VTLCDVLVGAIWEEMNVTDRLAVISQIANDRSLYGGFSVDFSRDRLGSLMLLAWLLDDWPRNLESSQVAGVVRGWMRAKTRRVPTRIGPSFDELLRSRVPELLVSSAS
jgi:hypothetical protein